MTLPRAFGASVVLFILLAVTAGAGQESAPGAKTPKKGDTVVVKGCLEGALLRSTDTSLVDETATLSTPLTYQLKGDRKLLKQLRDEHDGRIVEVTGELKSKLPDSSARSMTVGKTRIVVGVGAASSTTDRRNEPMEALPVLDVKSFEGSGTTCRA
jgi:vacuolar-type H+-ATPase subunit F/Vma7